MDNPSEIESSPISNTELNGFEKFAAEKSAEYTSHRLSYREYAEYIGLKEIVSSLLSERVYRAYELQCLRERLDGFPDPEIRALRGVIEKMQLENQSLREQLRIAVEHSDNLSNRLRSDSPNIPDYPYIS